MNFELNPFRNSLNSGENTRKKPLASYIPLILFLLALSYVIYIPPQKSIEQTGVKEGDILNRDIIIRKDLTIIDEEQTKKKIKELQSSVLPVYEFLPGSKQKRNEYINRWYDILELSRKEYFRRKITLSHISEKINGELGPQLTTKLLKKIFKINLFGSLKREQLSGFIDSIAVPGIISAKKSAITGPGNEIKVIYKSGSPRIIPVNKLIDLKEMDLKIAEFLNKNSKLSRNEAGVISSALMEFIDVSVSYSLNLTKDAKADVTSSVNPVVIKLKTGRIILRKGDEVKASDLKILKLIEKEERVRSNKLSKFYVILFLMTFILFFMGKLFKKWEKNGTNGRKLISVSLFTLFTSAIIYRILLFILPLVFKNLSLNFNLDMNVTFFALPYTFSALIIAFIFNVESAVSFSFVNAIIGSILSEWNFFVFLYIFLGCLVVIFGIEYYQRLKRSPILKVSIIWLIPVNILFLLLYNLANGKSDLQQLLSYAGIAAFSALISAILASFLIPLWEILFNLLTDLKLVELTNLNLPIFREMLEKAPGTYHHSQMVSSLSESAALDLGLSPLLLNAMALYHDIGKIENPQVFTENHTVYPNPHGELTPKESARIIISHIQNGLERAKALKLSEMISAAIPQHHGTKLVSYFYNKAIESDPDNSEEIDKNIFRYQGEKPKSIETAIIMLADQVEAASKSLSSPSEEELRNVIQKIINSDIADGQFDECERLTFKAINIISNSFYKKLSSIYHMRISYPGFDFKENGKEENGKDQKG